MKSLRRDLGLMGGDLGGLGGRSPKKVEVGKSMHSHRPPPNILRSSVVGCARKYEQSEKRCHQGIFSEIGFFFVKKGSYMTEILGAKMEIFSLKNLIQKSWSAKFFSVPQTRRLCSD